ncbi:MAG TPA: KH domain-containing protein [Calditerricola sp.]
MKALVELIAKALVDHPDHVCVREVVQGRTVVYKVSVHPDDVGKVIGKQGRTAKALRTVVSGVAAREGKRVSVVIL